MNRKQIRLTDFDYSSPNSYFITICTKDRIPYFGEIRNGIMGYSDIGNIASLYLQFIPQIRKNVVLDEFSIMPDHLHMILVIREKPGDKKNLNQFSKIAADSISIIINRYKGAVTKWCVENKFGYFKWQGRFYDHIIRSEEEYWTIKNYIINNPRNYRRDMPPHIPNQFNIIWDMPSNVPYQFNTYGTCHRMSLRIHHVLTCHRMSHKQP